MEYLNKCYMYKKEVEPCEHLLHRCSKERIPWQLVFFSIWSKVVDAILSKRNSPKLAQFVWRKKVEEILEGCSHAPALAAMGEKKNKESFQRCKIVRENYQIPLHMHPFEFIYDHNILCRLCSISRRESSSNCSFFILFFFTSWCYFLCIVHHGNFGATSKILSHFSSKKNNWMQQFSRIIITQFKNAYAPFKTNLKGR